MQSPYEKLFGKSPNYDSLCIFGCRCFPCLHEYAKNKFDPRSLPRVFLGYSYQFKGYRCLHPPIGKSICLDMWCLMKTCFHFENRAPFSPLGELTTFDEWVFSLWVFSLC